MDVNGERLAYRDWNPQAKGNTLVLIHGLLNDDLGFRPVVEHPAMEDVRCVCVNMRGYGASSLNKSVQSHKEFAADIAGFIKALNLDKPAVLGWSTGGGVVAELAVHHPDSLSVAILMSSVPLSGLTSESKPGSPCKTLEEVKAASAGLCAVNKMSAPDFCAFWNTFIVGDDAKVPVDSPKALELHAAAAAQRAVYDSLVANATINITTGDNPLGIKGSGLVGKIACPIVEIHGKKDPFCPIERMREDATQHNAGKKIELLEHEFGHYPMLECNDQLVSMIGKALSMQAK